MIYRFKSLILQGEYGGSTVDGWRMVGPGSGNTWGNPGSRLVKDPYKVPITSL